MEDIFQNRLFKDLEKLNFTLNESRAYLTLLRMGPSLAGAIAKETKMDRSSTYNALDALVKRGIVAVVRETKRAIYVPQDPKKIIDYYQEKEEIAKRITGSLREHYTATKTKSNVLLFKGYKGLKTVLQDVLDSTPADGTYYVIGAGGQFKKNMPYYINVFRKQKEEKKIKTRRILEGRTEKKNRGKYTEYRTVPINIDNPATINIYDGKVAIFLWGDNPEAVLIDNERVSRTLRAYFDMIWKDAKKV